MVASASCKPWSSFNVREDALGGLGIGRFLVFKDAGKSRRIEARVSELRRLGDFATWRAARAVGDHDLNTFALRADPVARVGGLDAGMTVWIEALRQ